MKILCVGKTKQPFIIDGIREYEKRLRLYDPVQWLVVPDVKLNKSSSVEQVKKQEAAIILKHLAPRDVVVALDERGTQFASVDFAKKLEALQVQGPLVFVIGGVYGLDAAVCQRANLVLGFSSFTFTHQMIRLLLVEQIYRAHTILHGKTYHY
ncbi:MAG: 23S rRNA (pseudouridine(1915)-N(3))-methyltransferase RlmH [Candidatus Cloacimonetes bacterium]|nr:23S rRNA (pseudouridine(1915)-N(3))-methyltransferase RlmH [Candidatus Cloacimonadota bacterium]